jgi:mono/diheme cytochrome c family protein
MNDDNENADPRKGITRGRMLLLVTALVFAAGIGAVGYVYLQQERKALLASDEADPTSELGWMFIDAGDVDLVIEGRKVYEANCASCHGLGLEGQPDWQKRGADGVLPAPPHDDTGHTWHHPDALLFAIVKLGGQEYMPQGVASGMPAYQDLLSDREIEASLAYIKSRWARKNRRRQEMLTNQRQ